jgi:hypothetical protein
MLKWNNLNLSVTHSAGNIRRGTDINNNNWSQRVPYAYGEILGTEGTDKKPVNVIIGPYLKSKIVFVCSLPKNKTGEDKCLIGFLTKASAKKAFLSCYGGDVSFLRTIKEMSLTKFVKALASRRGMSLIATGSYDFDLSYTLSPLEPIPTGWNTEVENPGDKKLTKEERRFNTDLALRQGKPEYVTVSQGADINVSPDNIYSQES